MKLGLMFLAPTIGACVAVHPSAPSHSEVANELAAETVALVDEGGDVYCSGVWVTPHDVLTAAHCVADLAVGDRLFFSQREDVWHVGDVQFVTKRPATLARVDAGHDLALVHVETPLPHNTAQVSEYEFRAGDHVSTMGHPLGLWWSYSSGEIASVRFLDDEWTGPSWWIQTTAPISPGNSGGGLFDASGRLIGIAHAQFTRGQNLNLYVHRDYVAKFLGLA